MLREKVAVVTGGSRGIGRAISIKMAENGADVAIIYAGNTESAERTATEIRNLGVKAQIYRCNVADFAAVAEVFAQIKESFGRVDILVNNAGITRDKLLMAMKEPDFDEVLDVNLKGAFNTMKQVYPMFLRQKSGRIINISSVSGIVGNPGQANYSASKAGLIGMTKSVARELASRGICCNVIAPGFVETDMTDGTELNEALLGSIPMKRMGKPEEIANLAVFLASPQADYITGSVINVDGGLAM